MPSFKCASIYSSGERVFLYESFVSTRIYVTLKAQCLDASSRSSGTTKESAAVLLRKLSKYNFSLTEGYAMLAQIVAPRIANRSITESQKQGFRDILLLTCGLSPSATTAPQEVSRDTDTHALFSAARAARK